MHFGIWTLLPALLVILCAIVTRRSTESLLLGVVSSYAIIAIGRGQNFITLVTDSFFSVLTDYDTMWMLIVIGLLGSLIALLTASKSTHAIAQALGKICKTEKSTLLTAWLMGIVIFIDDYLNILTISACLQPLTDKHKTPRESLAYIIDSTGAPVCVLLPLSSWAIFFANVFYENESVVQLGFGSAMQTYIHAIPYMFYAIAAVVIVPLFIVGVLPKLGAMKKAYERVQRTGMVYSEKSAALNNTEPKTDAADQSGKARIWDFLIPMATMIVVQLITDDMFLAVLASILVCAILYIPGKRISGSEFCDIWIRGFADFVPMLAIIVAALCMRQASADLHLPDYVIEVVQPICSLRLFPMIAFIVVAVLGFITGSNWGIPAVCAPIIIPLGASLGANLLVVMAAIVSGGVFCSHACFYSDATVLASASCQIDNLDHVYTQLPYVIIAFVLTCAAYLVAGFVC